jgi:outer membrane protein assembly factor BamB
MKHEMPTMQMTRRFATFGLVGLLALAAGCKNEPAKAPEQPKPAAQNPATTTAPADLPKAQSSDAPKVAADPGAAGQIKGFDPMTSPQSARVKGWYQWRGPEQNGISREKNLPDSWDPEKGENVVWTADVGSMSSPVIWNGKLYTWTRVGEVVTGTEEAPTLAPGPKTQEALTCVDISNGKVLWRHVNNMTQTEVPFHRLGWSSPVVDPSTGRVYALGSQCWFLCLEGDTGKVVWQRQMTEEFGMISTFGGRTPAPSIDEDQVFIAGVAFGWGDNARGQHRIFAFNKHTGEQNWSAATGGTPVDAPQGTPVVAVIKGERLVIFGAGDGGIHAFQARTGKKVWTKRVSKRGLNTSVCIEGDRLYCAHGLDNFEVNKLGRLFCLDLANLENGAPKELWAITGVESAFPTPVVVDKLVFFLDDSCLLYAVDKETGQRKWKLSCGRFGKASPVYGDGKLYIADADRRFSIVQIGETDGKVLSKVDLPDKLGREYSMYGSPAICDGRVYIQTATKIYCIAKKDAKPEYGEIPPMPAEKDAEQKVAQVQVIPADVVMRPGEKIKFTVRTFDANGRYLGDAKPGDAKFAIAQLTIPPPPPRANIPRPDVPAAPAPLPSAEGSKPNAVDEPKKDPAAAVAAGEAPKPTGDAGRGALIAAPAAPPTTGPTKAGNLMGEVAADGTYAAVKGPHQAGAVEVTVGSATAQARVRVFPPLPWKFDFQAAPVGKPPLTWLGAGGKYAVVQDPDDANNKVLQKLMDIDLYYRARTNFGAVDMTEYTLQADVKVEEKTINEKKVLPDGGIINQRYVLILNGLNQTLQIHIWPSALPGNNNPSGSAHATAKFPWEAKKWYRLKLQVTQEKDKAVARGKCWIVGQEEPKDWNLTLDDIIPNRSGNPGLFAVSLVGALKSEVYYDNLLVTDNRAPAATQPSTPATQSATAPAASR